jgi:hypothetical protein
VATDAPSHPSRAIISPGPGIAQRGPLSLIQANGTSTGRFATSNNSMVRGITSRISAGLTVRFTDQQRARHDA